VLANPLQAAKIREYLQTITRSAGLPERRLNIRDDMTVVQ
jgi:hypothetical protein